MRYKKSDKGHAEIASSARELPQRLRMLLLLVDGRRNEVALQQMLPAATPQALATLLDGGYIERVTAVPAPRVEADAGTASVSPVTLPPPLPEAPALPLRSELQEALDGGDRAALDALRTQVARSLKRALGPAAASLIETVNQAHTLSDLSAVLKTAQHAIQNARGWRIADEFASRYGSIADE